MTTTRNSFDIPTPYDEAIANYNHLKDGPRARKDLQLKREGYLRAKTEDAPLLEALKALMPLMEDTETYRAYKDELLAAEKAIAQAEGRTP